ncbi:MAG: Cell shape determining protein, MreB/Mrl family [Parcubacteria group bacterium GW2011_GWA2_36_10]|nr:MAG: Cell shape determining protein, MreB/Mrl family [Parcubacteria group bacterium GW2011_GWA2_36_10]
MFIKKIGIDLGTTYTLVYIPKRGIVINEPSVVAISVFDKKVLAVGDEAKDMIGRTPDSIIASRPLKNGVIADYKTTESMLRYFINKAVGGMKLFRPEVMIAVPAGITSTERRAVIDATLKGGGTSEIAVISLGGIVANTSVKIGGNKYDTAIGEYIKKKYNLAIGESSAEAVKIRIGSAQFLPKEEKLFMDVKGRDMITGLPRTISVSSDDVTEALQNELQGLISAVKSVLYQTPPELSADIMDKGMVLSGGTALLRNMDKLLSQATGVPAYTADDALLCVARGTGIALENLESYKRSILSAK